MHATFQCNDTPHGNGRGHCGNSTILPIHAANRTTIRINQDSKERARCQGGGTFCCLSIILTFMILLLVQLLVWRFFDIDILPVDDSIANHEMSNSSIHMIAPDIDLNWHKYELIVILSEIKICIFGFFVIIWYQNKICHPEMFN